MPPPNRRVFTQFRGNSMLVFPNTQLNGYFGRSGRALLMSAARVRASARKCVNIRKLGARAHTGRCLFTSAPWPIELPHDASGRHKSAKCTWCSEVFKMFNRSGARSDLSMAYFEHKRGPGRMCSLPPLWMPNGLLPEFGVTVRVRRRRQRRATRSLPKKYMEIVMER